MNAQWDNGSYLCLVVFFELKFVISDQSETVQAKKILIGYLQFDIYKAKSLCSYENSSAIIFRL